MYPLDFDKLYYNQKLPNNQIYIFAFLKFSKKIKTLSFFSIKNKNIKFYIICGAHKSINYVHKKNQ